MNEISKKIIMDEIKGLMNGISSIVGSSMLSVPSISYTSDSSVTVSSISDINTKAKSIKAYVAKIEEKTKLLEEDLALENAESNSDQIDAEDPNVESNE